MLGEIKHVALIADGARRWSRREKVPLRDSYRKMMDLLALDTHALFDAGAHVVTLYLLSKENLRRSSEELEAALAEEKRFIEVLVPQLCTKLELSVRIAGNPELLPGPWSSIVLPVQDKAADIKRKLNLCIAYSPEAELSFALKRIQENDNTDSIIQHLWVDEPVDLLIRTGGARTLSNFIPLQCGYANLVFLDELFNDTSVETLLRIVREHVRHDFKYGW
jgi:undecaprenyl diphosphate synthase